MVKIGSQTWMAQNLNYDVPDVKTDGCYENKVENCAKYGRLYDWETATKACPVGWRLPIDEDWKILADYAGGGETSGTKLKSKTGWKKPSPSGEYELIPPLIIGTDDYGFSALPGGSYVVGYFHGTGIDGRWWSATEWWSSATENDAENAWYFGVGYGSAEAGVSYNRKTFLYSVRCVQYTEEDRVKAEKAAEEERIRAEKAVEAERVRVERLKESITTFTDKRDGKTYKKVKINTQTWMAENLNYAINESKCHNNDTVNCTKYGSFYTWEAAISACPAGYHLPSDDEWITLENSVGGSSTAGTKLKSTNGWNNYNRKSGNGTDEYGFSALPGGIGHIYGINAIFANDGNIGGWWSATKSKSNLLNRFMAAGNESVYMAPMMNKILLSVRCVQDIEEDVVKATQAAEAERVAAATASKAESAKDKVGNGGLVDGKLKDSRDGKTYEIFKIGNQTWMKENLNYAGGKHSVGGEKYGRLYTWDGAMKACPAGSHLPSEEEWTIFERYIGNSIGATKWGFFGDAGLKVGDELGAGKYGFSPLLGGMYSENSKNHAYLGEKGYWWSSTEEQVKKGNAKKAFSRYLGLTSNGGGFFWSDNKGNKKTDWYSVRCILD
jgi:uncharacterized protein (TIGR02145 family)